jgi:8-oxo-dGTP diphosphatase
MNTSQRVVVGFLVTHNRVWLAPKLRKIGVNALNGYGGELNENENPFDGLLRELPEESTVIARHCDLRAMATLDIFRADEHLFVLYIFLITAWCGTPIATEEMGEPRIFHRDDLPLDEMMPGDRFWAPQIMQGFVIPNGGFVKYDETTKLVIEHRIPDHR